MSSLETDLKKEHDLSKASDSIRITLNDIPKSFVSYWSSLCGYKELTSLQGVAELYNLTEDKKLMHDLEKMVRILKRGEFNISEAESEQLQTICSSRFKGFANSAEIQAYIYKRVTLLRALFHAPETSSFAHDDYHYNDRTARDRREWSKYNTVNSVYSEAMGEWDEYPLLKPRPKGYYVPMKKYYSQHDKDQDCVNTFLEKLSTSIFCSLHISHSALTDIAEYLEKIKRENDNNRCPLSTWEDLCHALSESFFSNLVFNKTDLRIKPDQCKLLFSKIFSKTRSPLRYLELNSLEIGNFDNDTVKILFSAISQNSSLRFLTISRTLNTLNSTAMDLFINEFLGNLSVQSLRLPDNQLGENLTPLQFKNLLSSVSKKSLHHLDLSGNVFGKLIKNSFNIFCDFIETAKVTHLCLGKMDLDFPELSKLEFDDFCSALQRNKHIKYVTILGLPRKQMEIMDNCFINRTTAFAPTIDIDQSQAKKTTPITSEGDLKNKSETDSVNTTLIQYGQQRHNPKSTNTVMESTARNEEVIASPYFFKHLTQSIIDKFITDANKNGNGPFLTEMTEVDKKRSTELHSTSYQTAPYFIRPEKEAAHLSSCMVLGFFAYRFRIEDSNLQPTLYVEQVLFKIENGFYCMYNEDHKKKKGIEKTKVQYSSLSEMVQKEFLACPFFGESRLVDRPHYDINTGIVYYEDILVAPIMELQQEKLSLKALWQKLKEDEKRIPQSRPF